MSKKIFIHVFISFLIFGHCRIHAETSSPPPALTIADAVDAALDQSHDITIERELKIQAEKDELVALGSLLPQVSANARYTRIDRDRAEASFGGVPLDTTTAGITVTQMIFSDPTITEYRFNARMSEISDLQLAATRLDVVESAARAFIELVSAEAIRDIKQSNVELTRENLNLANARKDAGMAGPEEVFRWEAELAVRETEFNDAQSSLQMARTQLNKTMSVPLSAKWRPVKPELTAGRFVLIDNKAIALLKKTGAIHAFVELARKTMLREAPELKALDIAVKSQALKAAQLKRRFFVPEVSLQFQYDHTIKENLQIDSAAIPGGGAAFDFNGGNDDDWNLMLQADFPLFQGGARFAELARAKAEIRRLSALKNKTRDMLEQSLLNAVHAIAGSLPNIDLKKRAAEAAIKNLDVTQGKYANGKASIIDLIDAQNQAFVQRQAATIAVYEFMNDMIKLQRAMAWFEFTQEKEEVEAWLNEIQNSLPDKEF